MKFLKSVPFQIVICVFVGIVFESFIGKTLFEFFYSLSSFIQGALMFFLPFIIIGYVSTALFSFAKNSLLVLLSLIIGIVVSNAIVVTTAYSVSSIFLPILNLGNFHILNVSQQKINLLFSFPLKPFIDTGYSVILGALIGFAMSKKYFSFLRPYVGKLKTFSMLFLTKFFVPLLPIYVFGFSLALAKTNTLPVLMSSYGQILILTFSVLIFYLFLYYMIGSSFNLKNTLTSIKNMIPAGLTGLTSMSSVASTPLSIDGISKNTNDKNYGSFIFPSVVNFHLVGDSMSIPIEVFAIMLMSGKPMPSIREFSIFLVLYCMAKFSCAAVPGAGIIVILPVAKKCFGLSDEAQALLTTLYILKDPFLTFCNVMGNGAFSLTFYKIFKKLTR